MSDIVERYEKCASLWPSTPSDWVEKEARNLLFDAIAEIKRLRSLAGKAGVGPSFSDVTSELRHQTPSDG